MTYHETTGMGIAIILKSAGYAIDHVFPEF